jgi:O-antigen ligase
VGATIAVLAAAGNASGFRLTYQSTAERIGLEGVNVNFTAYSLVTATAVMVALVLFRRNKKSYRTLVAGCVFFVLVYLGVVLTGARGALASLVGLIAWLVVSGFLPRLAWRLLIVTYVIANVAIASGWSDAALGKLVTGSTRETGDLNGRLGVWPLARHVFREHWLLGGGAGSLPSQPGNTMGINAHAVVLDVAAGLGMLGIVAFACVWVFALLEPLATADTRVVVTRAVGAFLVVSLPVILSGFWFESIVLWAAIALFSRIDLLAVEGEPAYSDDGRGVTLDR